MRVIAGRFRSRKLKAVAGLHVRPTPDRLREALFNVLANRIAGSVFLDGYAGTGAVGIEALSRGAKHSILIEKRSDALAILRENLASLDLAREATVVCGSTAVSLAHYPCDIAFLDPPYDSVHEYAAALSALANTECPLVVAQHSSKLALADDYGSLHKQRVLKQGDNSLSFFGRA